MNISVNSNDLANIKTMERRNNELRNRIEENSNKTNDNNNNNASDIENKEVWYDNNGYNINNNVNNNGFDFYEYYIKEQSLNEQIY